MDKNTHLERYDEMWVDSNGIILVKWGATYDGPHIFDTLPRPRNAQEIERYLRKYKPAFLQIFPGSYLDVIKERTKEHFNIGVCVN